MGQGNISVYTDRQAKALAVKSETEIELAAQQKVLAAEEASRVELAAEVKAHSGSIGAVKKDIEDVELAILKVEQDKGNRDHTIKVLQAEVAEQNEVKILLLLKKKWHTLCLSNLSLNQLVISWRAVLIRRRKVELHLRSKKEKLKGT